MSPTFTDDEIGKPVENATGDRIGMVTAVESGTAYVEPDPGITDSIKAALGWESTGEGMLQLAESDVGEITEAAVLLEDVSTMQEEMARDERDAGDEREIGTVSDESADSRSPGVGDVDRDGRSQATETEHGSDAGIGGATRDEPETDPAGGTSGLDETEVSEEVRETDRDRAEEPDAIERERSARGAEVDPSELTDREPEAELQPEEGAGRTDAEVEPDADASRSDAEVEPESDPRHTDAEVDPEAIRDEPSGPTTEDVEHTGGGASETGHPDVDVDVSETDETDETGGRTETDVDRDDE